MANSSLLISFIVFFSYFICKALLRLLLKPLICVNANDVIAIQNICVFLDEKWIKKQSKKCMLVNLYLFFSGNVFISRVVDSIVLLKTGFMETSCHEKCQNDSCVMGE